MVKGWIQTLLIIIPIAIIFILFGGNTGIMRFIIEEPLGFILIIVGCFIIYTIYKHFKKKKLKTDNSKL